MANEKIIKCMDMEYYTIKVESLLMKASGNMINLMDKGLYSMKNLKNFMITRFLISKIFLKYIITG